MQVFPRGPRARGVGRVEGGRKRKRERIGETVVNHFCVSRVCEVGLGSVWGRIEKDSGKRWKGLREERVEVYGGGEGGQGRYGTITSQYSRRWKQRLLPPGTNARLPLHALRCNGSRIAFNKINSISPRSPSLPPCRHDSFVLDVNMARLISRRPLLFCRRFFISGAVLPFCARHLRYFTFCVIVPAGDVLHARAASSVYGCCRKRRIFWVVASKYKKSWALASKWY